MQRLKRIAVSLAIVTVVYWTYRLLAVPWIEPAADPLHRESITRGDRDRAALLADLLMKQLKGLFPPDAWELKAPVIFDIDRAKILVKKYSTDEKGRVWRFEPCTIVFGYDGPAKDEDERRRQSVILEAPEAVLKFDHPLDLRDNKTVKLESGKISGNILIRSDGKSPGPEDDLRITTRDVRLTERTVTTPNDVEFRFGPNHGRGRDMVIELLNKAKKSESSGPTDIRSFMLKHVDRLCLELGNAATATGGPTAATPVEIHCRGPFQFDNIKRVATFHDQVDVLKSNPTGPGDQIFCDVLSVHFAKAGKEPSGAAASHTGDSGPSDLKPERIEADGNPVQVWVPSQSARATCQHLEYNLITNRIKLTNGQEAALQPPTLGRASPAAQPIGGREQEVVLQQGANEIHARQLEYQVDRTGRLGRAWAQGPGWIRAQQLESSGPRPSPSPAQCLEARWNGELKIEPAEQTPMMHVLKLDGGTEFTFADARLKADSLFLWLTEGPPTANGETPRLYPHHLMACIREQPSHNTPRPLPRNTGPVGSAPSVGQEGEFVHISYAQLTADVRQLEAWFVYAEHPMTDDRASIAQNPRPQTANGSGPRLQPQNQGWGLQPSPQSPQPASQQSLNAANESSRHFNVNGRLLQVRILVDDRQTLSPSGLIVEDGVHIWQSQSERPGEMPLAIFGERLEVTNAENRDATTVTVVGRPAQFEGSKLRLSGPSIELNCGTNLLSVNGAGHMDAAIPADPRETAQSLPGVLNVDWRRRMTFDGLTATFEDVSAANAIRPQDRTELETHTIEVNMQQPVRFSKAGEQQKPQVESVQCPGAVLLKNQTFDDQGRLVYNNSLSCSNLKANMISGEVSGGGGWLNSVFCGLGDTSLASPVAAIGAHSAAGAAATATATDQLACLHLTFSKSLHGRLSQSRQSVKFDDMVQAAYAPVRSWDATLPVDDPVKLGPDGMLLGCGELTVTGMPQPRTDRRTVDLLAAGNASVDVGPYTGLGDRISYTQAKDLLILRGDGRSGAQLFQQAQPGAQRNATTAREFWYSPKTKRWEGNGVQSLQLNNFPAPVRGIRGGNGR